MSDSGGVGRVPYEARHTVFHPEPVAGRVVVDGEEGHHLGKVLRVRAGEPVVLFDGSGRFGEGRVAAVERRRVTVEVERTGVADPEPERRLGLGLLKGKAMDEAVRFATVLGVTEIAPLLTRQGDVRIEPDRIEAKLESLRRQALEGCKQCGRLRLPRLLPPQELEAWTGDLPASELRLVASLEGAARPLFSVVAETDPTGAIAFAIGPAGDFSVAEYEGLREQGFLPVHLGKRVLRAEIALAYCFAVVDARAQSG